MKREELIQRYEYWKEHPAEFAEEVFGLKLFPFQKKILEAMTGEKAYTIYPLCVGRRYYCDPVTPTEYLLQGGEEDE